MTRVSQLVYPVLRCCSRLPISYEEMAYKFRANLSMERRVSEMTLLGSNLLDKGWVTQKFLR